MCGSLFPGRRAHAARLRSYSTVENATFNHAVQRESICASVILAQLGVGLVLVQALFGCGGGSSSDPQAPVAPDNPEPSQLAEPAEISFSDRGHGHFMGEATIANEGYYAEALLTVDGEVRIYVGGLSDGSVESGAPPPEERFRPLESTLFVGKIDEVHESSATGSGAVIGQLCDGASARFCDEPAPAELMLAVSSREHLTSLVGDLTLSVASEEERWMVELTSYSAYYAAGASRLGEYEGVFQERLAPFAHAEDVIFDIELDGRMRFASEVSGCVGDGIVVPHLDGRYDVHDVHLQITGCNSQFAYLNSEFFGLARKLKEATGATTRGW